MVRNVFRSALVAIVGFAVVPVVVEADSINGFTPYVIREGGAPAVAPAINNNKAGYSTPNIEFVISESGQKAGLGTNALNGFTIGSIAHLSIDRLDAHTRFTTGSGPYVAPYMNFWVKDANGRYAVLGNEPSNNDEWPGTSEWNTTGENLLTKSVKVYEAEAGFVGTDGNFADFASYVIEAPTTWSGVTNGAPRELGSNVTYGFNWIFGDTLSNYISGDEGYVVANPTAAAVPLPAAAWAGFALMGGMGLVRKVRGRKQVA